MDIDKQNTRHTISPQTHIIFIIPRPKGIGSCHKSETGNNQGRQQMNYSDNRCFNRNNCHSKRNWLSLTVIYVSPPLNNSVINPSRLSSVRQQSSRSSHNTPCDNWWFNSKDSNSNKIEFPSPVIPVPPSLNDSFINPTQMYSVLQQSSRYLHNTTNDLHASSIPR